MRITKLLQNSYPHRLPGLYLTASEFYKLFPRTPHHPPRFPVPKLSNTIQQYLDCVKPLVSSRDFEITKQKAKCLQDSAEAQHCQQFLMEKSDTSNNWLSEIHLDSHYLRSDVPLVVKSNTCGSISLGAFTSDYDWISAAARMIYCFIKLQMTYKDVPQVKNAFSTIPSGFATMCGFNRIPAAHLYAQSSTNSGSPDSSEFVAPAGDAIYTMTRDLSAVCERSRHILVAYKSRFFRVPVFSTRTNQLLPTNQIAANLERVLQLQNNNNKNSSESLDSQHIIGLLTTQTRSNWSTDFQRLIACHPENALSLHAVYSSLFCVCLDSEPTQLNTHTRHIDSRGQERGIEETQADEAVVRRNRATVLSSLHGNGLHSNSTNRWYDLHQLICNRDGSLGFCYEHSIADGNEFFYFSNFVYDEFLRHYKTEKATETEGTNSEDSQVCELPFVLPTALHHNTNTKTPANYALAKCADNLTELIEDFEFREFTIKQFDRNALKRDKNISPDAFIQIAIQLAWRRLQQEKMKNQEHQSSAQYEPVDLAQHFHLGRLETLQVCTQEMTAFCDAMLNNTALDEESKTKEMKKEKFEEMQSRDTLQQLLRSAATTHTKGIEAIKQGCTTSWHLKALRFAASQEMLEQQVDGHTQPIREFFQDFAFSRFTEYNLSTGIVILPDNGSGATKYRTQEGFGVFYDMFKSDRIRMVLTCSRKNRGDVMQQLLKQSIMDLWNLL